MLVLMRLRICNIFSFFIWWVSYHMSVSSIVCSVCVCVQVYVFCTPWSSTLWTSNIPYLYWTSQIALLFDHVSNLPSFTYQQQDRRWSHVNIWLQMIVLNDASHQLFYACVCVCLNACIRRFMFEISNCFWFLVLQDPRC